MMKRLICLTLAALMITGLACAEIATVETTIPLTQPDSPVTITLTCDSALEVVFDEDVPTGVVRATVHSDEHADVVISIAPSELYVGRSMAVRKSRLRHRNLTGGHPVPVCQLQ